MSKDFAQIISLIAFMSIFAVAILGFSLMMSESGHMMVGCFGTAPDGNCSILSAIEHLRSHMLTFQNISSVIVISLFAFMLLFFIAVLCFTGINFNGNLRRLFSNKRFRDFITPRIIQFTSWLAIHEKRDPSFSYAVNT